MADSILRLRLESSEYDNKIKRAVSGLMQMEAECRKVGGTLAVLEKDQLDYVKSLGNMETVSRTARGRISELSNAYVELAVQYRRLTDEEKKGDYGKALNSSLAQLKGRLNDAKKELSDVEGEMKGASAAGVDFNSVLASLGQRFGINSELMGAMTSGTLATTAAITAGAAAVAAATKMWADYNDELNRQTNVTTVTTGLKGDDAENLTIGVRALARTYDVDFREAINAANTLIQQFGVSGEQALSLLQDGMQGMIAGDGGKLLSMIQQYAPAFRDAGISASQLVAVIQNSEGGLFTDENMQAISMGIRNIRLMTSQTSNALAQLGIDGQEMSRKLEDGSMTIFDALRQVSGAIENVDSGSKAAGEVMQSVFGRSGFQAGTKLGEAIATLNTNLEETKTQTGELGESFVRLNEANVRLENTMKEVFGMTGWEDMNNEIKTGFLNTLSDAISDINDLKKALQDLSNVKSFDTLVHAINPLLARLLEVTGALDFMKKKLVELGVLQKDVKPTTSAPAQNGYKVTTDSSGKVVKTTRVVNGEETDDTENYKKTHPDKKTNITRIAQTTPPRYATTPKQEVKLPDGSVAALEKQLSDLQKAQKLATDTQGWKDYDAQINVVKEKIAALKGELPKDKIATFRIDAITDDARKALESIQGVHIDEKNVTVTANTQEAYDQIKALYPDAPIELKVKVKADTTDLTKLTNTNIREKTSELQKQMNTSEWGSDEYEKAKSNLADATAFNNLFEKAVKTGIDTADIDQSALWKKIAGGVDIDDAVWQELIDRINEKLAESDIAPIKIDFETGGLENVSKSVKDLNKSSQVTAQVVGSIGRAFNEIEDPAAKVAGTIAEAIAQVALGYGQALAQSSSLGPWGWIAFAATGMATMISSITAIKSNTKGFATGGIVPGNSFNDQLRTSDYGISSGELILNKAQQGNLASQLTGAERGTQSGTPYVDGEKIYLGINNFLRRSGRGEIVTSRR